MMRIIVTLFGFLLFSSIPANAENNEEYMSEYDVCQMIAGKLGSVNLSDCLEMNLQLTGAQSVNNTPILQKEYPPLKRRKPQAKILVIGGIHGDEYASVSIVFKWMKKLNRYHSGLFHWRVIPLLNPDGLLRKKSQRMNANGVDLNRNFPTPNWEKESSHYWVKRTSRNPRRYPGKAPLSEPETRWFAQEIESFKPDAIVSVHAPHGILDFDGPPKPPKRFGQLYLRLLGTYPGSLGNYAGVHKGIPVITIELPRAGIMPTTREISRIWVDLIRWMRGNLPKKTEQTPIQVSRDGQAGPS